MLERMGQNQSCFVQFTRWHNGRGLSSPTASYSSSLFLGAFIVIIIRPHLSDSRILLPMEQHGQSVMYMSSVKMAEPIEIMLFNALWLSALVFDVSVLLW